MPEEALQAAFEIKTACDEISRRLLRWHWEHKPGAHSIAGAAGRTRVAGIAQQVQRFGGILFRVQQNPHTNGGIQLLPAVFAGKIRHTVVVVRAFLLALCNVIQQCTQAVRTARNEAAHATDHTDAAQAAILFNEAVESLEYGYVGTAFRENELARYYRDAENYLARCGAKEPIASSRAPEEKTAAHEPARQSTKQGQNRSTQSRKTAGSRSSGSRSTTARSSSAKSRSTAGRKKKQRRTGNKTVFIVLLAVLLLGLAVRAWSMGAA